jgi:ribose/xylose/arabinose/galactoside ABC-type transport system permease subunit
MRRLVAKRHIDTWFLLIMTAALLVSSGSPARLAERHTIQNLSSRTPPLALVAMAMTFAISRHIDLSPGSMIMPRAP